MEGKSYFPDRGPDSRLRYCQLSPFLFGLGLDQSAVLWLDCGSRLPDGRDVFPKMAEATKLWWPHFKHMLSSPRRFPTPWSAAQS